MWCENNNVLLHNVMWKWRTWMWRGRMPCSGPGVPSSKPWWEGGWDICPSSGRSAPWCWGHTRVAVCWGRASLGTYLRTPCVAPSVHHQPILSLTRYIAIASLLALYLLFKNCNVNSKHALQNRNELINCWSTRDKWIKLDKMLCAMQ